MPEEWRRMWSGLDGRMIDDERREKKHTPIHILIPSFPFALSGSSVPLSPSITHYSTRHPLTSSPPRRVWGEGMGWRVDEWREMWWWCGEMEWLAITSYTLLSLKLHSFHLTTHLIIRLQSSVHFAHAGRMIRHGDGWRDEVMVTVKTEPMACDRKCK